MIEGEIIGRVRALALAQDIEIFEGFGIVPLFLVMLTLSEIAF